MANWKKIHEERCELVTTTFSLACIKLINGEWVTIMALAEWGDNKHFPGNDAGLKEAKKHCESLVPKSNK